MLSNKNLIRVLWERLSTPNSCLIPILSFVAVEQNTVKHTFSGRFKLCPLYLHYKVDHIIVPVLYRRKSRPKLSGNKWWSLNLHLNLRVPIYALAPCCLSQRSLQCSGSVYSLQKLMD